MAIDVNRGAFVKEEFRYEEASAPEVLAEQPRARIIKIDTNLDQTAAKALADEILADQKYVPQAYSITLAGVDVCRPSDFVGSPPTFLCNFPDWPVKLTEKLTTIGVTIDYQNWTTSVLIRGPIK